MMRRLAKKEATKTWPANEYGAVEHLNAHGNSIQGHPDCFVFYVITMSQYIEPMNKVELYGKPLNHTLSNTCNSGQSRPKTPTAD